MSFFLTKNKAPKTIFIQYQRLPILAAASPIPYKALAKPPTSDMKSPNSSQIGVTSKFSF